jgi:hypothetical protein
MNYMLTWENYNNTLGNSVYTCLQLEFETKTLPSCRVYGISSNRLCLKISPNHQKNLQLKKIGILKIFSTNSGTKILT